MDFDHAIAAHSAWKAKLKAYLKNPDLSLKAADVERDDKCVLGQWIYGEGKQWMTLPSYSDLRIEHAKFHRAAAAVVRKADCGQSVTEEITLGARSDFTIASAAVVRTIMRIKQEAH
jgi:hypothetical protein